MNNRDAFYQSVEEEMLDGLEIAEGRMTKLLVVAEIAYQGGSQLARISMTPEGHQLRGHEQAGLLTMALTEVLD